MRDRVEVKKILLNSPPFLMEGMHLIGDPTLSVAVKLQLSILTSQVELRTHMELETC